MVQTLWEVLKEVNKVVHESKSKSEKAYFYHPVAMDAFRIHKKNGKRGNEPDVTKSSCSKLNSVVSFETLIS